MELSEEDLRAAGRLAIRYAVGPAQKQNFHVSVRVATTALTHLPASRAMQGVKPKISNDKPIAELLDEIDAQLERYEQMNPRPFVPLTIEEVSRLVRELRERIAKEKAQGKDRCSTHPHTVDGYCILW